MRGTVQCMAVCTAGSTAAGSAAHPCINGKTVPSGQADIWSPAFCGYMLMLLLLFSLAAPGHCSATQLKCAEGLPEQVTEASLEDDSFLQKFHHALLEVGRGGARGFPTQEHGVFVAQVLSAKPPPCTAWGLARQGNYTAASQVMYYLIFLLLWLLCDAFRSHSRRVRCVAPRQGASSLSTRASPTCCSQKTSAEGGALYSMAV